MHRNDHVTETEGSGGHGISGLRVGRVPREPSVPDIDRRVRTREVLNGRVRLGHRKRHGIFLLTSPKLGLSLARLTNSCPSLLRSSVLSGSTAIAGTGVC